jgi:hypothetical protein
MVYQLFGEETEFSPSSTVGQVLTAVFGDCIGTCSKQKEAEEEETIPSKFDLIFPMEIWSIVLSKLSIRESWNLLRASPEAFRHLFDDFAENFLRQNFPERYALFRQTRLVEQKVVRIRNCILSDRPNNESAAILCQKSLRLFNHWQRKRKQSQSVEMGQFKCLERGRFGVLSIQSSNLVQFQKEKIIKKQWSEQAEFLVGNDQFVCTFSPQGLTVLDAFGDCMAKYEAARNIPQNGKLRKSILGFSTGTDLTVFDVERGKILMGNKQLLKEKDEKNNEKDEEKAEEEDKKEEKFDSKMFFPKVDPPEEELEPAFEILSSVSISPNVDKISILRHVIDAESFELELFDLETQSKLKMGDFGPGKIVACEFGSNESLISLSCMGEIFISDLRLQNVAASYNFHNLIQYGVVEMYDNLIAVAGVKSKVFMFDKRNLNLMMAQPSSFGARTVKFDHEGHLYVLNGRDGIDVLHV